MLLQVAGDAEGLPADGTHVRLLPAVEPQVRLQVVPQAEALAALRAVVRPLAGVEACVTPQGLAQREGLGAEGAPVRLLTCVEACVAPEDLPPLELLATHLAGVAVARVRHHPLQAPHAVAAGCVAAQAMARVQALVAPEVFRGRG